MYVDNDVSAASGKPRPQYREMLAAVRAGRIDAILAWHADRLHRRPTELEEFIDVVKGHGVQVHTVKVGSMDLSTDAGQMVARMLGAAARYEVDQTRTRIRNQKAKAVKAGEYRGGKRPFGYEPGGMVVREAEAEMVREATTAILAGRSLRGIANEWNERSRQAVRERYVKRPDGQRIRGDDGKFVTEQYTKDWSALTVREMVLRPRNAGIMAHGVPGRRVPQRSGAAQLKYEYEELEGRAQWPAIVDEDEWRAVVRLLTDPSRRDTEKSRERAHLGAGLYVCGGTKSDENGDAIPCGTLMRSGTHGGGRGHYRCRLPGRGHTMVLRDKTDEHVRQEVAKLLRNPKIIEGMTPAAPDLTEDRNKRDSLTLRLAGFDADYKAGDITAAERKKFRSEVEDDIAVINAKIAAAIRSATSSDVLNAADPGQAFLDAALDVQRAIVASVVQVKITPNTRRGAAWTTDRVRFHPLVPLEA